TFSKGSTAMCSSWRPNSPAMPSRMAGINESSTRRTAAAAKLPSHQKEFLAREVGGGHICWEACSTVSRNATSFEADGMRDSAELGSRWLRNDSRSVSISLALLWRVACYLERARL